MKLCILIFLVFVQSVLLSQEKEYFTFKEALKEPDSVRVLSLGDYRFDRETEKIFEIDSTILLFANLEKLKFTCNYLDSLPSAITRLRKLRKVTILDADNMPAPFNNCKLDFSDTFQKLAKIKSLYDLYIPYIKFTALPLEIKYLTNISHFTLVENKLIVIPDEISQMRNLRSLCIKYNRINNLPSSMSNLDLLINLTLLHNKFDSIPPVIFNIKHLKYLDLSYNMIQCLPKEIENLKDLKYLDLRRNVITTIPRELFNCEQLEFLDLSNNNISEIPIEIFSLKNLKNLGIGGNNIPEKQIQILKEFLKDVVIIN